MIRAFITGIFIGCLVMGYANAWSQADDLKEARAVAVNDYPTDYTPPGE